MRYHIHMCTSEQMCITFFNCIQCGILYVCTCVHAYLLCGRASDPVEQLLTELRDHTHFFPFTHYTVDKVRILHSLALNLHAALTNMTFLIQSSVKERDR